jgi:hypothetical protein
MLRAAITVLAIAPIAVCADGRAHSRRAHHAQPGGNPDSLQRLGAQADEAGAYPTAEQRRRCRIDREPGGEANDQRAKGHSAIANRLEKRADKRSGLIGDLNSAKQRLNTFSAAHCKPAGPAK